MTAIRRITLIAGVTFLEGVRQRFFYYLSLIALVFVGTTHWFRQLHFGGPELKFTLDFGLGTILFFGTIVAIMLSAQSLLQEIEHRTAAAVLARPVPRHEFIAGKYLGILSLLSLFVMVFMITLAMVVFFREGELMRAHPEHFDGGRREVRYSGIPVCGMLLLLKLAIIAGITLCIASFSKSNLYTVVVAFLAVIIGHLQFIAAQAHSPETGFLSMGFAGLISILFPNFQVFSLGELLVYPDTGTEGDLSPVGVFLYGAIYSIAYLTLSIVFFRAREI